MFQHACLDTCCFECLIIKLYACVWYFCICPCSAQMSMFHMERRSRNTLIIINIFNNNNNNNVVVVLLLLLLFFFFLLIF